ncbi:SHOCT-like domain-containing protein [Thermoflexus hugenholtzii]
MTRDTERLRILKMIEAGQITAEQGLELLRALQEAEEAEGSPSSAGRWLRIRVTDMATGRPRVHVNVPLRLLDLGLRIGGRLAPEIAGLDLRKWLEQLRASGSGKLVEVLDEEEGERVEITVE